MAADPGRRDPDELVEGEPLPGTEDPDLPGLDTTLARADDARSEGLPAAGELPALGDLVEPTGLSDTEIYQGELEATGGAGPDPLRDPLLSLDLRSDESGDPNVAAEEGVPYVPPTDPPTVGVEPDGDPLVASGFGTSALDEPYDEDHRGGELDDEPELTGRIREALRADAETAGFADEIAISVVGDRAILTGRVEDLDDADAAVAVAERADGIGEVIDRLEVAAVDETALGDVAPRAEAGDSARDPRPGG